MKTIAHRKLGRPLGRQHDAAIQLRLPRAVVTLLRRIAAREGLRVPQVVRAAIEEKLLSAAKHCNAVIEDPSRSEWTRLRAVELLRLCLLAGLHLGPAGLKIARAEAAGLAAR